MIIRNKGTTEKMRENQSHAFHRPFIGWWLASVFFILSFLVHLCCPFSVDIIFYYIISFYHWLERLMFYMYMVFKCSVHCFWTSVWSLYTLLEVIHFCPHHTVCLFLFSADVKPFSVCIFMVEIYTMQNRKLW